MIYITNKIFHFFQYDIHLLLICYQYNFIYISRFFSFMKFTFFKLNFIISICIVFRRWNLKFTLILVFYNNFDHIFFSVFSFFWKFSIAISSILHFVFCLVFFYMSFFFLKYFLNILFNFLSSYDNILPVFHLCWIYLLQHHQFLYIKREKSNF